MKNENKEEEEDEEVENGKLLAEQIHCSRSGVVPLAATAATKYYFKFCVSILFASACVCVLSSEHSHTTLGIHFIPYSTIFFECCILYFLLSADCCWLHRTHTHTHRTDFVRLVVRFGLVESLTMHAMCFVWTIVILATHEHVDVEKKINRCEIAFDVEQYLS